MTVAEATLGAPWLPASTRLRAGAATAGAGLAAAALLRFGVGPRGLIAAFFLAVLVLLAAVDLERCLLPNKVLLPAAGIVLVAQLAFFGDRAAEWVGYSLGAAAVVLVLALVSRGGVGMGDVKLSLLLGAALGEEVLAAVLIGLIAIWPVALFLLVRDGGAARKRALPLGPALAFGATVVTLTVV